MITSSEIRPDADAVVQAALKRRRVPFGAFHRRRLVTFVRDLTRLLARLGSPGPDAGTRPRVRTRPLLEQAAGDLLEELAQLAGRTLVALFHEFRVGAGMPVDAGRDTAYRRFEERVGDAAFETDVSRRYPVLDELLTRATAARLVLLDEVLDAAHVDWSALLRAGLASDDELTGVRVGAGDAHNGGRRVVSLHGERGGGPVYKPRPLAIDAALGAAAGSLNPWLEDGCGLRLPAVLPRPTYGWQEHVVASSMTCFDEVRRHRYRTGAFLALFAALGSTDLHHENVVSSGEHPMFVDTETALQHQPTVEAGRRGGRPSSPLLSTMLLPLRVAGHSLDVDLSGIGTATAQVSHLLSFSLLDAGTDAVRFERAAFEVTHGDNLARLGGIPVPSTLFVDDLLLGFGDALEGIRVLRSDLLAAFEAQRTTARQVLRPTQVYGRFLAASTHPRYLTDVRERRRLLSRLSPPKGLAPGRARAVLHLEHLALDRHDIPYFEVDVDGADLRAPLDGSVADVYPTSLLDRARTCTMKLLSDPPERHEHHIRMCLATTTPSAVLTPLDARPGADAYLREMVDDRSGLLAPALARLLAATALRAGEGEDGEGEDGEAGQATWLTPSVDGVVDAETLLFRPGDVALYEGGGIPLLLAAVAAGEADTTGGPAYARLARRAVHGELPLPDPTTPRGLSLFSGLPASAYVLHELGSLLDDPELLVRRDELWRDVLASGVAPGHHEVDVVGGHAAAAAYAVHLAEQAPHLDVEGFVRHSVRDMVRALASSRLTDDGVAHGRVGVAWCLARCASVLGDTAALAVAEEVLTGHAATVASVPPHRVPHLAAASWCKGTAGSLLALGEGLSRLGWSHGDVDDVVDQLVRRGLLEVGGRGRDLSPCHGATGMVQALLALATLLRRPELRHPAAQLLHERRRRAGRDGYGGGLAGSQGFLGYMLGLTGVGHSELLLEHDAWGVPLALTSTRGGSA